MVGATRSSANWWAGLFLVALVGACGSGAPDAASTVPTGGEIAASTIPPSPLSLAVGVVGSPTIDTVASDAGSRRLAELIATPLAAWDAGRAAPGAAVAWSTPDTLTWRFGLDPDAQHHDGSPVMAADVMRGLERGARSGRSFLGSELAGIVGWSEVEIGEAESIRGVTVINDATIEVELISPNPFLPELLADVAFSPVISQPDPVGLMTATEPSPMPTSPSGVPVANGPMRVASVGDRVVELVPAQAGVDGATSGTLRVVAHLFADATAVAEAFRAGQVDVVEVPWVVAEVLSATGVDIVPSPGSTLDGLLLPNSGPFADVELRRTLSATIDREGIAADASMAAADAGRHFVVADRPVPAGWDSDLTPCRGCDATADERIIAVEQLSSRLSSADLTIHRPVGVPGFEWVDPLVARWSAVLGAEVDVIDHSQESYADVLADGGTTDIVAVSWSPRFPSGVDVVVGLMGRDGPATAAGWSTGLTDQLIAESTAARIAGDEGRLDRAITSALEAIGTDLAVVPVVSRSEALVSRVADVAVLPGGRLELPLSPEPQAGG